MKVSAYFAASLDGFIAREDGSIDWLDEAGAKIPKGEDCGYQKFLDSVDTLIMGRKTFDQVLTFGPWPYGETPVIVLSRKPISFPPGLPASVSHSAESPATLCTGLANAGVKHIYVDGGATIQGFLAEGLIDEVIVTVIPVLLGGGISPYGKLASQIELTKLEAEIYDFGFVQVRYSIGAKSDQKIQ